MIDKRTAKLLAQLCNICADGSYKIIEKTELLKTDGHRGVNVALEPMINFLRDNEMIDMKYSDETQYCLTVLPKGRVTIEQIKNEKHRGNAQLSPKMLAVIGAIAFVSAFIGAFLGALLGKL